MSEYLDENNEHKYRCDFCGIDNLSEEEINSLRKLIDNR